MKLKTDIIKNCELSNFFCGSLIFVVLCGCSGGGGWWEKGEGPSSHQPVCVCERTGTTCPSLNVSNCGDLGRSRPSNCRRVQFTNSEFWKIPKNLPTGSSYFDVNSSSNSHSVKTVDGVWILLTTTQTSVTLNNPSFYTSDCPEKTLQEKSSLNRPYDVCISAFIST